MVGVVKGDEILVGGGRRHTASEGAQGHRGEDETNAGNTGYEPQGQTSQSGQQIVHHDALE